MLENTAASVRCRMLAVDANFFAMPAYLQIEMLHGRWDGLVQIIDDPVEFFIGDDQSRRNDQDIAIVAQDHAVLPAPIPDKCAGVNIKFLIGRLVRRQFDGPKRSHAMHFANDPVARLEFGKFLCQVSADFCGSFDQVFLFDDLDIG